MPHFEIESMLGVDPDTLWTHATSPAGVNAEFWPLLRMTFPADTRDLSESWQPGVRMFRSWILLFGVLPVEYDDLTFVEVEHGKRFLERSAMATQHVWQHERVLVPTERGTVLRDRVVFEPRVAMLGGVQRLVFRQIFRYRHFRLSHLFPARVD